MSLNFEELDYRPTPIGTFTLRRRRDPKLGIDIFEIKLGDEFLTSSLFTASEIALARLGVAALESDHFDIVVGGLGLGYTAQTVLEYENVHSLIVVEMREPVIEWHQTGILPVGRMLADDNRCRMAQSDFFRECQQYDRLRPRISRTAFRCRPCRHRSFTRRIARHAQYGILPAERPEGAFQPFETPWGFRTVVER